MKKVNEIKAKKLFEEGYIIRVVPNKLDPEDGYGLHLDIKYLETNTIRLINEVTHCDNFDFVISKFKDNILNFEGGYYLDYYILK